MKKTKVRETDGYTVYKTEHNISVEEYLKQYVDVPKFHGLCRACPNYGVRWSCPPFAVDPMEIWKQYETLQMIAYILEPQNGQTTSGMLKAFEDEKRNMILELKEAEDAEAGSTALWPGTCYLCSECTRANGGTCRMPEKMRYSIEALGGDVGKTTEDFLGCPILWVQEGKLPAYMTLVGGILHKKR